MHDPHEWQFLRVVHVLPQAMSCSFREVLETVEVSSVGYPDRRRSLGIGEVNQGCSSSKIWSQVLLANSYLSLSYDLHLYVLLFASASRHISLNTSLTWTAPGPSFPWGLLSVSITAKYEGDVDILVKSSAK